MTEAAYMTGETVIPRKEIGSLEATQEEKLGWSRTPATITATEVLTLNFRDALTANRIGMK
jgi:hypothetical protein